MDLTLSEEQRALDGALGRFLAKASSPEQVRAAEPVGFDPAVWHGLVSMGVPTMGVPAEASPPGGGAALADLGVVAHACGRHLAPAPVVEAMVAHRLLNLIGDEADSSWRSPDALVTIAVRPAIAKRASMVPAASVADVALVLDGDHLVLIDLAGDRSGRSTVGNLARAPLADVEVPAEAQVLASGGTATEAFDRARDEWRALTAMWLHGLGRAALDLGVQYAKDRRQFGVPIGSFQAVQHRLADLHTDLEGAWLLVQKALWALDVDNPGASSLAPMALTYSGDATEAAAVAALHYHGGYGFMEEYDIQLYFRRAMAARLVLGDPRRELQTVADRLFGRPEAG